MCYLLKIVVIRWKASRRAWREATLLVEGSGPRLGGRPAAACPTVRLVAMHWRTRRDKGRFRTQAERRHVHLSTDVKVFPRGRSEQPFVARRRIGASGDREWTPRRLVMETDAASAESRKRKREEYEMQLFGFNSRAVYATRKPPPAF